MANTIADKLARLEQTKQELYDVILKKGVNLWPDVAFSAYPKTFGNLRVLEGLEKIYSRNLSADITNGSGRLLFASYFTGESELILEVEVTGSYNTPHGDYGDVRVSGEIVVPLL